MAYGLAVAVANAYVDFWSGEDITAPAAVWVQLATGDPGAAGTANASAETGRRQLLLPAASGGSAVATAMVWSAWSVGTETLKGATLWTAASGGTFLRSVQFTADITINNSGTFTLNCTVTATPLAA